MLTGEEPSDAQAEPAQAVEDLVESASQAPAHGLSARSWLLQAARQASRKEQPGAVEEEAGRGEGAAVPARLHSPESLFQQLQPSERPLVPYRKSVIARLTRQVCCMA